jgi:acyl dehydratase
VHSSHESDVRVLEAEPVLGMKARARPQSTSHASGAVEIAVNNGHNQASFRQSLSMTLAFEDFPPGHFGSYGPRHVSREEILAFAAEFDPQPMHLDEAAASRSMLGGLSGSGWHLCAIMMRMMFDFYIGRTASLGSPGVNELRWLAPLRPGDDLTLDVEVAEARVSRSRPETGILTFRSVARNAAGVALCEMVSPIIVRRRADAVAEPR